jgi:hypothetical protein
MVLFFVFGIFWHIFRLRLLSKTRKWFYLRLSQCRTNFSLHTANEGPVRIQYKCLGSHLCIPRNESVIFHNRIITFCLPVSTLIYIICERFIYFHDRSAYFAAGKYVDRSWKYIKSLTDMNVESRTQVAQFSEKYINGVFLAVHFRACSVCRIGSVLLLSSSSQS